MCSSAAAYDFLELWPFVHYLVAAFPPLLKIVKDRLSTVELALSLVILSVSVLLIAAGSLSLLHCQAT